MFIISIPLIELFAVSKDLKPSVLRTFLLINLWSCSTILFKYLICLSVTFLLSILSSVNSDKALGYAGFLSTVITLGVVVFTDLIAFFKEIFD